MPMEMIKKCCHNLMSVWQLNKSCRFVDTPSSAKLAGTFSMGSNGYVCAKEIKSVSDSAYIGRQSIYDRKLNVYAYELLYRSEEMSGQAPAEFDGNMATSNVMMNTFFELGLDTIVGNKIAFINLTQDFIDGTIEIPAFKNKVVLEVLENIEPSQKTIDGMISLKQKGFDIALDDFSFEEKMMPLIDYADLIKVDITLLSRSQLEKHVLLIKKEKKIKLLAEKIETKEEFDHCKSLGFDYYQGYFLEKPSIVKGQKMPANKVALLQLLIKLQNPDVEIDELEKLIVNDASLTFKLMRYINSPAFNVDRNITSIKQILMILGLNNLKQWMTLIVISGIDDKPSDLIRISLVRAKMCVKLAETTKQKNSQEYFLLGIFSMLDAMLDQDLETILNSMPLKQELKKALLNYEGIHGSILKCIIAYERGDVKSMRCGKIPKKLLRQFYLASLSWADETVAGFST